MQIDVIIVLCHNRLTLLFCATYIRSQSTDNTLSVVFQARLNLTDAPLDLRLDTPPLVIATDNISKLSIILCIAK